MKITSEVVAEKLHGMKSYGNEHFGIPNGEDFQDFAKVVSQCSMVGIQALLHFMLISMSMPEISKYTEEIKQAKAEGEFEKKMLEVLKKSGGFTNYLEVMYLGYLLGKHERELEKLEEIIK